MIDSLNPRVVCCGGKGHRLTFRYCSELAVGGLGEGAVGGLVG